MVYSSQEKGSRFENVQSLIVKLYMAPLTPLESTGEMTMALTPFVTISSTSDSCLFMS